MKTKDFEKAIDALGVQGLSIEKFSFGINGQVVAVYAQIGENVYLMWDSNGRGFRFDIEKDIEGQFVVSRPEYLDYRRDNVFDLTF